MTCDEDNEVRSVLVTGTGITDGVTVVDLCYKEGYFYHVYGSVNVSFDRQINNCGLMFSFVPPL
jgi:hypothetical protein